MFEIDFLKKQGLPQKHRPIEVGLYTAGLVFLILVLSTLYIQYFYNNSVLKSKQDQLTRLEATEKKSTGYGSIKSRIEKSLSVYDQCYFEIAGSIGRYVQWTPVLWEFTNSLPHSMLLNELSVIRTVEKKSVTSVLDPSKKVDFEVISRTVKSNVYDFSPESDSTAIGRYLESLRGSEPLKGLLSEAYIVESSDGEYKDPSGNSRKVKNYIVNCLLKSQEVVEAK